ncbi:MAG: zinc ribbon domain-containing protein [Leptolyngbya sp. SIO4C1]|nr:zinc ribbon domain-containing protein [Leptolyngbya sp. SIO4C1]
MAYVNELSSGTSLYVDNQGEQTIVTLMSRSPGQQQQSSNSFTTGPWTAPPEIVQTAAGVAIKLSTAQGEQTVQVQGNVADVSGTAAQPMQKTDRMPAVGMRPMRPMPPMKMGNLSMGNMSMKMQPMEMRMGDMELRMDRSSSAAASTSAGGTSAGSAADSSAQKFCTQCGTPVSTNDRFCGHCGHQLKA